MAGEFLQPSDLTLRLSPCRSSSVRHGWFFFGLTLLQIIVTVTLCNLLFDQMLLFFRSLLFLRLQVIMVMQGLAVHAHACWWLFTRHSPSFASCPLAAGTKVTHESCDPARRRAITFDSCFPHPKRHCSSIQTANHGTCKSLYVGQE